MHILRSVILVFNNSLAYILYSTFIRTWYKIQSCFRFYLAELLTKGIFREIVIKFVENNFTQSIINYYYNERNFKI